MTTIFFTKNSKAIHFFHHDIIFEVQKFSASNCTHIFILEFFRFVEYRPVLVLIPDVK